MKRSMLENWPNLDKLCLVSAISKTGAQNWNAVSRMTRNIYENVTKFQADGEKRSAEWFSMKQCAAQYDNMLKNVASRRKYKRNDRSGGLTDPNENSVDSLLQYHRQEYIEELMKSAAETRAQYMKIYKEHKELLATGRQNHKLPDMLEEIEAKERDKEIKKKLKLKLGEKNADLESAAKFVEEKSTPDKDSNRPPATLIPDSTPPPAVERPKTPTTTPIPTLMPTTPTSLPPKPNVTTSPLLTSLLQSPSPISRPPVPSSAAPTISIILNTLPSAPPSNVSDSPTLSKLLESPSCPFQSTSNVPCINPSLLPVDSAPVLPVIEPKDEEELDKILEDAEMMLQERKEKMENEKSVESQLPPQPTTAETVLESILQDVVEAEVVIEQEPDTVVEKKEAVVTVDEERLAVEVPAEPAEVPPASIDQEPDTQAAEFEQSVIETVEEIIEKVEEAAVEIGTGDVDDSVVSEGKMNKTTDSETPEEDHLEGLELDQDAVELIVVGPTPCPVTVRDEREFEEAGEKKEPKEEAQLVEDEVKPEEVKENAEPETEVKVAVDGDSGSRTSTPEVPKLSPEPHQPSTVESVIIVDDDTESTRGSDLTEKKIEPTEVIINEDVSEQSGPGGGEETEERNKEINKKAEVEEPEEGEPDEVDRESTGTAQSEQRPVTASPPLPPVIKELQRGERVLQSSSSQDESSNDAASLIEIKSVKSEETEKDATSTTGGEESLSETERKEASSGRRRASRRFVHTDNSAERRFSRRTAGKENKTKDMPGQTAAESKDQEKRNPSRKRNAPSSSDSVPRSVSPSSSTEDDKDYRSWKKTILLNFDMLAAHKFASVFLKPITEAEAPGYHEIVKRPMDLTTIKRNIENGTIRTTVDFQRDMLIMVENAIMYHASDSLIFKMAQEMLTDFREKMGTMVQALGHGVPLSVEEESKPSPRARVSKIQPEESQTKKKRMSIGSADEALRSSKRKRVE